MQFIASKIAIIEKLTGGMHKSGALERRAIERRFRCPAMPVPESPRALHADRDPPAAHPGHSIDPIDNASDAHSGE